MTVQKSTRKKPNCFKEIGEAVDKCKDTELIESSSINTGDPDAKSSDTLSPLKESFLEFQNQTTAQFCHMEYTFRQLTESITALHDSLAELHSHQNKSRQTDYDHSDISSIDKTEHVTDINDVHNPPSTYPYNNVHHTRTSNVDHNQHTTTHTTVLVQMVSPAPHKFWKIVQDDRLKPHRFHTLIKDIILQDD